MSKNKKMPTNRPLSDLSQKDKEKVQSAGAFIEDLKEEVQSEINPEATPLWAFINRYMGRIALVVLLLLIAMLMNISYQAHKKQTFEDLKLHLGQLEAIQDPAQRIEALNAMISGKTPEKIRVPILLSLARSYIMIEDYANAQTAFEIAVDMEKGTALGRTVAINLANVLLIQGKAEESILILETVLEEAPKEIHPLLYFYIAESAEIAGNFEHAKSAYASAIQNLPNPSSADAMYYQSRIDVIDDMNIDGE